MDSKQTVTLNDPFVNAHMQRDYAGAEGFLFEEDFVEENVRCIPMIVRFKLDLAGIKLKLSEWSRFTIEDRLLLTRQACVSDEEIANYHRYLKQLVLLRTGNEPTLLAVEKKPLWSQVNTVPVILRKKAAEYNWQIPIEKWKLISRLQRFALLKLCRPGHENKNFPKAMHEFGLSD